MFYKKNTVSLTSHTILLKTPEVYRFFTLPMQIPDKIKLRLGKLCWNFKGHKTKTHENSRFFLDLALLEVPLLNLMTPRISTFYFFSTSLEIPCSRHPPHWISSG